MGKLPWDYNLQDIEDFKLVEVGIEEIVQASIEAWDIILTDRETLKSIIVLVDLGQVTSVLFGLSQAKRIALSPTICQFIQTLCKYSNLQMESVIINEVESNFCKAKIVLKNNERLVYFDISAGDALAIAITNDLPIYTLAHLLQEIDEDEGNILEFEL